MALKRLGQHLGDSAALPSGLLARAARLHALNVAFVHWASRWGSWAQQVQLANIEAGRVAFIADSAAPLTPLRYRQAEVLAWVRAHVAEPCERLSIVVRRH